VHRSNPIFELRPLWDLSVYFDGACPLCIREVNYYQRHDPEGHIRWVDISAADFDAKREGLDPKRVHEVMHVKSYRGRVYTELDAFLAIWRVLPRQRKWRFLKIVVRMPGIHWLLTKLYRLFARNRYRLTGRCHNGDCTVAPHLPA